MAPEQVAGESVTTATDVWALGAMMHEMLTGQLQGKDGAIAGDLLDPRLRAIVACCLQVDASRRYDGASGFVEDLEAYLDGCRVSVLNEGLGMRMGRWSRRHPALAGTVVVALVLAGASGGLAWRNWKITRDSEKQSIEEAARFREQAYVSDVYLASRALADNQLGVAREMLARHGEGSGSAGLRGFEWYALSKIAEGDQAQVFRDHEAEVRVLEFDPTGRYLLSGGRDGKVIVREVEIGE